MDFSTAILDIGMRSRMRIVVADDEKNIATLIEDILSEDYEVITAFGGHPALEKAKWNKPDLMIVDVMMPDIGGFEVARALQSDAQTADIPIIMMTAKAFDDTTVKMLKAEKNVFGYLRKPFGGAELKGKILEVLAVRAARMGAVSFPAASDEPEAAAPLLQPEKREEPPPKAKAPLPEPPPPTEPTGPPVESRLNFAPVIASRQEDSFSSLTVQSRAVRYSDTGAGGSASSWFVWIAAAAFTLVLAAVVIGEWRARAAEAARGGAFFGPPLSASTDPAWPFEWTPPVRFIRAGIPYNINAFGLRGRDPGPKSPGTRRLVVLGGTEVFGEGLYEGDGVCAHLERLLESDGVEVLNAGLWGYSSRAQWSYYEKRLTELDADIVVWARPRPDATVPSESSVRRWLWMPGFLRGLNESWSLARWVQHSFFRQNETPAGLMDERAARQRLGAKGVLFVPAETPAPRSARVPGEAGAAPLLSAEDHAAWAGEIAGLLHDAQKSIEN